MNQCWPDGSIRAWLDCELPPEESALLSAHLDECSDCRSRSTLLRSRADRVLGLVGGLSVPAPASSRPAFVPMPRPRVNWWVAAGVAIAAAWAAFVLLLPRRVEAPPAPFAPQPPAVAAIVPPVVEPSPAAGLPVAVRPAPERTFHPLPRASRGALPAAPQRATLAGFVPLDDDPIDAGVVMRVLLAQGQMQADVVYSPDGRPRAIRLVNATSGK